MILRSSNPIQIKFDENIGLRKRFMNTESINVKVMKRNISQRIINYQFNKKELTQLYLMVCEQWSFLSDQNLQKSYVLQNIKKKVYLRAYHALNYQYFDEIFWLN